MFGVESSAVTMVNENCEMGKGEMENDDRTQESATLHKDMRVNLKSMFRCIRLLAAANQPVAIIDYYSVSMLWNNWNLTRLQAARTAVFIRCNQAFRYHMLEKMSLAHDYQNRLC